MGVPRGPFCLSGRCDQAASLLALRAKRLRTTSAAAAPPNSSSIGGAGTGVGGPGGVSPFDEDEVDEDDADEVDALVEADDADEVLVDTLPLEEVDVETLPLDEVEVETLPLEDVEVDTLPLEEVETFPLDELETLPLLPPEADEVLLVLDTPPVLVEEPPAEVEVEPLVLEVDDTTIPLDPPDPPPPKNPPAKKPPPIPPPPVPPTSTGPGPKPPPDIDGMSALAKAGGRGTGSAWLATVTTVGAQTVLVRVTMRLTIRFGAGRAATRFVMTRLVIARFVISRCCDDSATWTAPPPITAPPHAHAHSFANAIFTDMQHHSSQRTSITRPKASRRPVLHHQGERNRKVQAIVTLLAGSYF